MIQSIKNVLPKKFKDYIISKLISPPYLGNQYHCEVCGTDLAYFHPLYPFVIDNLDKHGCIHNIFQSETLSITTYACPKCGASDRSRLYALYLDKNLPKTNEAQYTFVDFAPDNALSDYIKRKYPKLNYRTADLYREDVDDKVDLMNIEIYGENSIDFFICSHILEHLSDDMKGLKEMYKILSPKGFGIMMAPISLDLEETYENPDITSPEDRWKHFGQDDHYRIYAKQDFINRIQSVGFKVEMYNKDYFGEQTFALEGINPRSVLYIVKK